MPAYLGLGANLGDPEATIREALRRLETKGLGKIIAVSSWYRTEPVGITGQPWFINAAAAVETGLGAAAFHAGLLSLEAELGRPAARLPNGPRPIDLDLLLFDDQVISGQGLEVPHPRLHQRRFVLTPLAEIAPQAVHPVLGKTILELLQTLTDPAVVEKI